MRLTLRTLLAYLDDTLEPLEIRTIGQKVGESDGAQELIARIKQVTRRRRITTPPATGPNAFDPNMVADYLDNELASEQVAELEKICLESDVHLAEVAACHQILTLVLGEPALVPPTAKERMYALVRGREAIPFRKVAAAAAAAPTAADADADEMFLLGLPFYRRGSWLRWALPVAGVLLLAVVAVALWQSIAGLGTPAPSNQVAVVKPDNAADVEKKPDSTQTKKGNPDEKKEPNPDEKKAPNPDEKKAPVPVESKTPNNAEPQRPEPSAASRKLPPSKEREDVGKYYFDGKSLASILVQRKDEEDGWHRLKSGTPVGTTDHLVSLPGYASEIHLDNGIRLLLRGHVREFSLAKLATMDYLQESAVVLHKNKDVDLDLTLERGRLYVSNHKDKGSAIVRLRFKTQVWDLTLEEPGTELVMDLLSYYERNTDYLRRDTAYPNGEEPSAHLFLLLMSGKATLAVENDHYHLFGLPGPAFVSWNNGPRGGIASPMRADVVPPEFQKVVPVEPANRAAEPMSRALDTLSRQMALDKVPAVVLGEVLQKEEYMPHRLAIYCLGALDDVKMLLGILGDADPGHAPDRNTAIFTLHRWLARDARQGSKLYDVKTGAGLLKSDREFTSAQAEIIFRLLHDFNDEDRNKPETFDFLANCLVSEKVAIAELARWHLLRLSGEVGVKLLTLDRFNAAYPRNAPEREAAAKEVKAKVEKLELPPRGTPTGPGPGPSRGPGTAPTPKGKN